MRSLSLHVILNRDQVEKLAKSYVCTGNPTNRPFQTPLHPGGASGTSSHQWKHVEVRNAIYRSRKLKACGFFVHLSSLCGGGLVAKSWPTLATPWTVASQAPLSMGFSRQEYWSGQPFPSPGDLSAQGSNPGLPHCRQVLHQLSYEGSPSSFQPPDYVDQSVHHHYIRL